MHFDMKNYLKNTCNHTTKHAPNLSRSRFNGQAKSCFKPVNKSTQNLKYL
jgi:hypothetical protein